MQVLGLTTNMDQLLNMQAIEKQGAGLCLRQSLTGGKAVYHAAKNLLQEPSYTQAAHRIAALLAHYNCKQRFSGLLEKILT